MRYYTKEQVEMMTDEELEIANEDVMGQLDWVTNGWAFCTDKGWQNNVPTHDDIVDAANDFDLVSSEWYKRKEAKKHK